LDDEDPSFTVVEKDPMEADVDHAIKIMKRLDRFGLVHFGTSSCPSALPLRGGRRSMLTARAPCSAIAAAGPTWRWLGLR